MSDTPESAIDAAVADAEREETPVTVPFCGEEWEILPVAPVDVFRFFGSAGNVTRYYAAANDILETAVAVRQRAQLRVMLRTGPEGTPPTQREILAFVREIIEADALRPTTP